jgi:hypothetical protein
MNSSRWLLFSISAIIVAGCGGADSHVLLPVQNTAAFSVTSSVYWYDLAPSQDCQVAVAYSRMQSDAQPIPQVVVHGATLVRENETLPMDYAAIKIQRQGGDLWVTTTACSQANNFAAGERLNVVLHVTVEGIGTLDVQPPATSLTPSKHPPP